MINSRLHPRTHPRISWLALTAMLAGLGLSGCGGGTTGTQAAADSSSSSSSSSVNTGPCVTPDNIRAAQDATTLQMLATPISTLPPDPCVASGKGTDYAVGPGQLYAELDAVPWESLKAGDTVRIHWRAEPYRGKFVLGAVGTADAPVRVCGVKGLNGERPVIDGDQATTRAQALTAYGSNSYAQDVNQARGLIAIVRPNWEDAPAYIQIDGLHLTHAHPTYRYTDANGATQTYWAFGAAIWIDRGQHIRILDNEISDSQMAVFSRSTPDADFTVTRDIRIAGNHFHGHGNVGSETEHALYLQSIGTVIEFNRFGPMRSGAYGNQIKDRSAGTIVRYNLIEDGAHAIDLVEAEDFRDVAMADPSYRTTLVHGNLIRHTAELSSVIHYGGDHYADGCAGPGNETSFRKGTLYFFDNTLQLSGQPTHLLQISTTEETAEVWNNIIFYADNVTNRSLRFDSEVGAGWVGGGIVNLGRNWISSGWLDIDADHSVRGQLNGSASLISGSTAPIDSTSWQPLAGSTVIDAAVNGPAPLSGYRSLYQINVGAPGVPMLRRQNGSAMDLGAIEGTSP